MSQEFDIRFPLVSVLFIVKLLYVNVIKYVLMLKATILKFEVI